ncbi:hypothetical protein FPV67DRAFT_1416207 [Lyophyllum atratum]|nr:hypothetical protein FPV67DRAFT_1416207 [Lyophyllum atratum]
MPPSKKRKHSGLSGLELLQALESLKKLRETVVSEGFEENAEEDTDDAPDDFVEQIDRLIGTLGSKVEGPQSLSFSSITRDDLAKMNIVFTDVLWLKPNWEDRLSTTTSLGEGQLWTSENFYRQLHLLETLVPRTTEATARAWIDTFFFRVSAMLPEDKRMVLNMSSHHSSNLATISSRVDYTAFVGSKNVAEVFLERPHLHILKTYMKKDVPSGFFVVEAKVGVKLLVDISDHVPQAVSELYACGRFLRTKVLRGALTDGHSWVFLLMKFNENFDGAVYQETKTVRFTTTELSDGKIVINKPWPDVIAAILSHWIENSFADLGSDDWFEVSV